MTNKFMIGASAACVLVLGACGGEDVSTPIDSIQSYFDDPSNATGVGSLADLCDAWNQGFEEGAVDTLRAALFLSDDSWSNFSETAQTNALETYLSDNC